MSSSNSNNNIFTIQPHPATTNDPNDLNLPQNPSLKDEAFYSLDKPGPQVVDASQLGELKSQEELDKEFQELNEDK